MTTVDRCDMIRSQRGPVPAFGGGSIWFLCWGRIRASWAALLTPVFSMVSFTSRLRPLVQILVVIGIRRHRSSVVDVALQITLMMSYGSSS